MTPNNQNSPQESNINIRNLIIKILVNWPYFILSIGAAYTIAFLINRYTEPIYSVSASVMINEERKTSAEVIMSTLDRYNPKKTIDNEIEVLKSYSLTKKTLSELDFFVTYVAIGRVKETQIYKSCLIKAVPDSILPTRTDYPFFVTVLDKYRYELEIDNQYHIQKIMKFGEPFKHPDFNFTVYLDDDKFSSGANQTKIEVIVNDTNSLTNYYRSLLNVSANDKKSSLVTLSLSGPVRQQMSDYLNKLCIVYIRNGLEEKNKATTNTIKFIDLLIGQISDSLKKTEIRMQNFRLSNNLNIDLSDEGKSIADRLLTIQSDKAAAQMKMKYFLYLKNYVKNKTNYEDIIAPAVIGIDEPVLSASITDLIDIYKQKAGLAYSVNADNPSISIINLKLKKIIEALQENINEIIKTTQIGLNDLNERIGIIEDELKDLPVKERQYLNLRREFDINNNTFTFLLQKRAESGIVKASNTPESKILDIARPENAYQIKPTRSKNYITAVFIGGIIPLIIIFLLEMFNSKITDLKELERSRNCTVIGSIGHNIKQSDIPVVESPRSAIAESFRSLRTNLQFVLREKTDKIILITSTISGEGKTFCAVNLAAILSMSNKKVLLMSLDLRKPRVNKLFNIPNDIGLSTYLINQCSSEEIVFSSYIDNLYIVPSGPLPPNPAELLETEKMGVLIAELKQKFDFIIFDTPPVAIVTDSLLLSKFADTTIFVVRQNFSSKDVINLADELVDIGGFKQLNILVNDAMYNGFYGYSYKYGYQYGYKYGYSYYSADASDYYSDSKQPKNLKGRIKKWLGG